MTGGSGRGRKPASKPVSKASGPVTPGKRGRPKKNVTTVTVTMDDSDDDEKPLTPEAEENDHADKQNSKKARVQPSCEIASEGE